MEKRVKAQTPTPVFLRKDGIMDPVSLSLQIRHKGGDKSNTYEISGT